MGMRNRYGVWGGGTGSCMGAGWVLTILLAACRRAVAAKPGRDAPRNSASRSSPRSWCSVSFVLINGAGGAAAGWQLFAGSPLLPTSLTCPPPDLKRFSEARIRASKLTTFVNFPLKDLDLREFASQSCSKRWGQGGRAQSSHVGATDPLPVPPDHAVYNLYAVSNHSGTTMGGHYTAYCKSPISSEWHSFNDSR